MKRQPYLTNHRLHVIGLALTVILASCRPLEQPTVLPAAIEMPTLSSIMPETMPETMPEIMLLMNNLVCPSIPSTAALLPLAPYDEELGDCALIGRSGEIEVWLTELEQIAESCYANRETNWASTLAARDNLDSQIDELAPGALSITACLSFGGDEGYEPSESIPFTNYYTIWLKRIGENVGEYCTMIDELIKPLRQACDEINFYQDCQAPNPEQYHSIIEWKMNAAQINYDYTDFFYTNTLQTYGWGNFRVYFNEASIDCPIVQQLASIPTFTFSKNAFCRKGPSVDYEDVTAFLQHQSVQIDGRNQDEPRWWWVLIPGSSGHCWVSDSTGSAVGFLEGVNTVAAPPLPPTPVCTRDLPQNRCEAAGGTWRQDPDILTAVIYFCDCSK
ncbi:MAG: hypothetical protein KAS19_11215 [Anaerolineales bacterium]|nr:hypothetical protein [Anaerolineales bacterium]